MQLDRVSTILTQPKDLRGKVKILTGGDTSSGGTHTVRDLEAWDALYFGNFGYSAASDATAHMSQSGADVVFSDQGVTATFEDVTLAQITDDMILMG